MLKTFLLKKKQSKPWYKKKNHILLNYGLFNQNETKVISKTEDNDIFGEPCKYFYLPDGFGMGNKIVLWAGEGGALTR